MARWIASLLVLVLWGGSSVAPARAEGDNIFGKDAVKKFRVRLEAHQYRELREWLATVEPTLAGRSAELQAGFQALKAEVAQSREQWLTECVTKWLFEELQGRIRLKLANVKLQAGKVQDWVRTRLERQTLASLVKRLEALDDASAEEVRAAWTRRKRAEWRTLEIPRGMTRGNVRIDDDWWGKASLAERRERVLLVFVESGDLFHIGIKTIWSDCPTCKGSGLQSKQYANGETLRYICKNCGGAQRFASIAFR